MAQIVTKFITDNAATDQKIDLRNNQPLRSRNAANSADVDILLVDTSDIVQLNPNTQINSTPAAANDVANKSYVDTAVSGGGSAGMLVKLAVEVATSANITLSGTQTIDGVGVTAGQRVLVRAQTTGSQNGIYVVAAGAWSRSTDLGTGTSTIQNGCQIYCNSGTQFGGHVFALTNDADPINVGVFALSFQPVNTIASRSQFNLTGTDITNQYVNLLVSIEPLSDLIFVNGVMQRWATDYTTSTVSGVTRITFAGDLATGGPAALVSGDSMFVHFRY